MSVRQKINLQKSYLHKLNWSPSCGVRDMVPRVSVNLDFVKIGIPRFFVKLY